MSNSVGGPITVFPGDTLEITYDNPDIAKGKKPLLTAEDQEVYFAGFHAVHADVVDPLADEVRALIERKGRVTKLDLRAAMEAARAVRRPTIRLT